MRASFLALIAAATLLAAPAAQAGPTCENRNGDDVRCGVPGAMPVGWALSPAEWTQRHPQTPMAPDEVWGLIVLVGGLFALIALMPDFDGWSAGDWDPQQGDDE